MRKPVGGSDLSSLRQRELRRWVRGSAAIEPLEKRRLLASAVIDVSTNTLNVTGDATGDTITISPIAAGITVKVNSSTFTFDPNSFNYTNVDAGAGNDIVTISVSNSATLKGG